MKAIRTIGMVTFGLACVGLTTVSVAGIAAFSWFNGLMSGAMVNIMEEKKKEPEEKEDESSPEAE